MTFTEIETIRDLPTGDQRSDVLLLKWEEEPKLVKVHWDDATNLPTWHSREEIESHYERRPFKCENIGYLIATDALGALYVAARKGLFNEEADAWGLIERIPKGVITSLVWLKEIEEGRLMSGGK